jgi:predicted O-methyltransferase YrrM
MNTPSSDPSFLYRTRDAIASVDALATAIVHLDLFTSLASEPATTAGIAERFDLHPRSTDVLCTLLLAQGLLTRDTDGIHTVSNTAREFLVAGSAFDARPYYAAMAEKPGVADFLRVLQTGKPANWPGEEGEADWHAAMKETAFAEAFTAAMDCRGRILAPALAQAFALNAAPRILDVGGGSGVYAIAFAEQYPDAQATVFESSPVDQIAARTIAEAGLASRIAVVSGDMFTDAWPTDHSVHLFSNVLHDWDAAECQTLLARSAEALPAGGTILVHDMLLDDDKAGPLWAAEYSVLLSTVTQGRLYAAAEIGTWLADHGFVIRAITPTALGRSVLTASR